MSESKTDPWDALANAEFAWGFYVRVDPSPDLAHCSGDTPQQAIRDLVCGRTTSAENVWVWRAGPTSPAGRFHGPVGLPRLFSVTVRVELDMAEGVLDETASWRDLARRLLDTLRSDFGQLGSTRTGVDAVDDLRRWLRENPDSDISLFRRDVYRMLERHDLGCHPSACEALARTLGATYTWAPSRNTSP